MKQIELTTAAPINVTPMTPEEARECVTAIIGNMESLGAMLLDLDRRRGWEALGYRNFRECAMAEFGKSQGYVYKLLHAAEVDENLAASEIYPLDKSSIALIPTSHKQELHKLPPDKQALALNEASELAMAEGKPREVKHVVRVVKEYKSIEKGTEAEGESLGLPTWGDSTPAHTPFVSHKSDEHYTPKEVLDAVVACLGGIDLDPCSNNYEKPNVPDAQHYTQADDGFNQGWNAATVFMNPPYSEVSAWLVKLIAEYQAGNVREALDLSLALAGDLDIEIKCENSRNLEPARLSASKYAQVFPGLIVSKSGSPEAGGGVWLHPDLAIQLAQWCNPLFAIQVSRWVREWIVILETDRHAEEEKRNQWKAIKACVLPAAKRFV